MRRDVSFPSEGRALRGWLYRLQGNCGALPGIVMADGPVAVKEWHPNRYGCASGVGFNWFKEYLLG